VCNFLLVVHCNCNVCLFATVSELWRFTDWKSAFLPPYQTQSHLKHSWGVCLCDQGFEIELLQGCWKLYGHWPDVECESYHLRTNLKIGGWFADCFWLISLEARTAHIADLNLECKGNYSAKSSNMKLVHWTLMDGLLHLVQRGGDWVGPQPAQAPLRCTKCNSPPINGQCINHRVAVLLNNGPLLSSFNVPFKRWNSAADT